MPTKKPACNAMASRPREWYRVPSPGMTICGYQEPVLYVVRSKALTSSSAARLASNSASHAFLCSEYRRLMHSTFTLVGSRKFPRRMTMLTVPS